MKSPLTILSDALKSIINDVKNCPPPREGGSYHEELRQTKNDLTGALSLLGGLARTAENALYNAARETGSVLQPWLEAIPIKMQSTLLLALRGPDNGAGRTPNIKNITRWLRGLAFKPGEPANVEGFMGSAPPRIVEKGITAKELEGCSQHYYSHLMHGLEVVGYTHPNIETRKRAVELFRDMCALLHLEPETGEAFNVRLRHKNWPGGVQPIDAEEAFKLITVEAAEGLKKGEAVKLVDGFVSPARIDEAVTTLRDACGKTPEERWPIKTEPVTVSITKTATPEGMPLDSSPRIKVSGIATEAGVKIAMHAAGTCDRETCPYCDVTRYREEFNKRYDPEEEDEERGIVLAKVADAEDSGLSSELRPSPRGFRSLTRSVGLAVQALAEARRLLAGRTVPDALRPSEEALTRLVANALADLDADDEGTEPATRVGESSLEDILKLVKKGPEPRQPNSMGALASDYRSELQEFNDWRLDLAETIEGLLGKNAKPAAPVRIPDSSGRLWPGGRSRESIYASGFPKSNAPGDVG